MPDRGFLKESLYSPKASEEQADAVRNRGAVPGGQDQARVEQARRDRPHQYLAHGFASRDRRALLRGVDGAQPEAAHAPPAPRKGRPGASLLPVGHQLDEQPTDAGQRKARLR